MDYNQINNPKPFGLWRILFLVAVFLIVTPIVAPYLRNKISIAKQTGMDKLNSIIDKDGYYKVVKVIDGDTIELLGGIKVRYIGINTPELNTNSSTVSECFASEAAAQNLGLLKDMKVKLVADKEGEDKYGRLLRYVYLPDGTFVNLELARGGYGRVDFVEPNTEFKNDFTKVQTVAQKNKIGLWGACE